MARRPFETIGIMDGIVDNGGTKRLEEEAKRRQEIEEGNKGTAGLGLSRKQLAEYYANQDRIRRQKENEREKRRRRKKKKR